MCGILFSTVSDLSDSAFKRALNCMAYRGPDADGVLRHNNLLLGHRRLAIIDLDKRANQPLRSADGRYTIIFNGEIYNYRELSKRHALDLQTCSDTEVLLALYALLGASMLAELNGMFAFVIVDCMTGSWFAARDRLGIKPLYQMAYRDGLLLSSEPAPLLAIASSLQFDPVGVRQYRKLRTFFNGRTLWQGISQFPAAHYQTAQGRYIRWWHLPEGEKNPPDDMALRQLIVDAVKIREVADVPVGAYLSGGLDSTIVTGLAQQRTDSWTIGFSDSNEFAWAQIAATAFGSRHHAISVAHEDFLATAASMIAQRCEPLSVPNEVLLYQMTREVAKCNKVVLSGEGADEVCFGYDRIFRWAAHHPWDLAQFAALYAYGSHDDLEIVEDAVAPFLKQGNALAIVAAFFQIAHLHGLLRRLDSATMLCSVEARVPFVDYRVVEAFAGTPFAWRMAGGEVKAPLKRIFADVVPTAILQRPKLGFPVPLQQVGLDNATGATWMDRWFAFNLSVLAKTPIKDIENEDDHFSRRTRRTADATNTKHPQATD